MKLKQDEKGGRIRGKRREMEGKKRLTSVNITPEIRIQSKKA